MARVLVYVFVLGILIYFYSRWRQNLIVPPPASPSGGGASKPGKWFKAKRNPLEVWTQVYETASMDEARVLQARLQEEDVECVLYEQGKKDIHGNAPKGVGLAVPKSSMTLAQTVISRLLS